MDKYMEGNKIVAPCAPRPKSTAAACRIFEGRGTFSHKQEEFPRNRNQNQTITLTGDRSRNLLPVCIKSFLICILISIFACAQQ